MIFSHGQDAIQEFQLKMRFLKNSRLYWCALIVAWKQDKVAPWVADPRMAALIAQNLGKSLALEEEKASLLVLPSGDLVVLGEAVSNAAYKRAKLSMEAMVADLAKGVPLTCEAYDLSVDWDTFLDSCRDIYARLGQAQASASQAAKVRLLTRLDDEMAQATRLMAARTVRPKSLNLLFVEDEPTIRQLLNNLLGESDHSLSFAANGAEAIEAYARKPPHIVFLDINLPDISGLEVLEMIARHDKQAHAVMLTSGAAETQVQTAVQQGVKGYIVKPFSRQKLTDCIERYYAV